MQDNESISSTSINSESENEESLIDSLTITKESHRDYQISRMIPPIGNFPVKYDIPEEIIEWISSSEKIDSSLYSINWNPLENLAETRLQFLKKTKTEIKFKKGKDLALTYSFFASLIISFTCFLVSSYYMSFEAAYGYSFAIFAALIIFSQALSRNFYSLFDIKRDKLIFNKKEQLFICKNIKNLTNQKIHFNEIDYLQILKLTKESDDSKVSEIIHQYQLNIVLKNGTRIHVENSEFKARIQKRVRQITDYLDKPILDPYDAFS